MTFSIDAGLMNTSIAGVIGLLGVAVGGWISSKNAKCERQQRLLQQKLQEFYGPLLALRSRIKTKSEIGLKISQLAGEEWPRLVAGKDYSQIEQIQKEQWPEYERIIEYENKQLRDETLPAYREMVSIFTTRMHLAESATRGHLPELINFVEVWDRWTGASLPKEVLLRLDHSEERLYPFYEDLEKQFEALQGRLSES